MGLPTISMSHEHGEQWVDTVTCKGINVILIESEVDSAKTVEIFEITEGRDFVRVLGCKNHESNDFFLVLMTHHEGTSKKLAKKFRQVLMDSSVVRHSN